MTIESDKNETLEETILLARNLIRANDVEKANDLLTSLYREDTTGYVSLQLANAKLYLGHYSDCIALIEALVTYAKNQKDALLTIAALVTKAEAILDVVTFRTGTTNKTGTTDKTGTTEIEVQSAIESFGQALGISELFTDTEDDKLTILPLAGLAHSHWLWGNPKKAGDLAERALARANALSPSEPDSSEPGSSELGILEARALLSKAIIQQTPEAFHRAIEQAKFAKHISLAKRAQRFYEHYQIKS